jgi:hypothetical protein
VHLPFVTPIVPITPSVIAIRAAVIITPTKAAIIVTITPIKPAIIITVAIANIPAIAVSVMIAIVVAIAPAIVTLHWLGRGQRRSARDQCRTNQQHSHTFHNSSVLPWPEPFDGSGRINLTAVSTNTLRGD